jgi:hypothetical protein
MILVNIRDRRDRMVVGFTTTCGHDDIAGNLLTWRYTTISICHFNTCNI